MLILLTAIFLVIVIISLISYHKDGDFGDAFLPFSTVLFFCTVIPLIVITAMLLNTVKVVPEKIKILEEENTKIERDITAIVSSYEEYEKSVYSEFSEIEGFIFKTPELNSNTLVQEQLSQLKSNHDKLVDLKLDQAMEPAWRWWVYFGG